MSTAPTTCYLEGATPNVRISQMAGGRFDGKPMARIESSDGTLAFGLDAGSMIYLIAKLHVVLQHIGAHHPAEIEPYMQPEAISDQAIAASAAMSEEGYVAPYEDPEAEDDEGCDESL